jgi:hypothetical protein
MKDYYCLDIQFPDVVFTTRRDKETIPVNQTYHAHLFVEKNEITLHLFYDGTSSFELAFMDWLREIPWHKFGSYVKASVQKSRNNNNLQTVDFKESKLISTKPSANLNGTGRKHLTINIYTIKLYWKPVGDDLNTGDFYLNDNGYRVIEPIYSVLYPKTFFKNDGNFLLRKMRGENTRHKIGNAYFKLEYNFYTTDNKIDKSATIHKEPKIHFDYSKAIEEKEALLYADIVIMLASFYYHIKIEYTVRKIRFIENTVTIKNISQNQQIEMIGNLWHFGIYDSFNKFLKLKWKKYAIKNFNVLNKAIALFNQSHFVDEHVAFLIRYNIIELFDKQKIRNAKFKRIGSKVAIESIEDKALNNLLKTIDKKEHTLFIERWNSLKSTLYDKPMKFQLTRFLRNQNLAVDKLPIKKLKAMRNDIIHGSVDKIDIDLLIKLNDALYSICGVIILNHLGIKNWKLKYDFEKFNG